MIVTPFSVWILCHSLKQPDIDLCSTFRFPSNSLCSFHGGCFPSHIIAELQTENNVAPNVLLPFRNSK